MLAASTLAMLASLAAPAAEAHETETYPVHFRGLWAPSLRNCQSNEAFRVGATKIWFYEADSKVLKLSPEFFFTSPTGSDAVSVRGFVAERGETEVGLGKLRLTLAQGKLYTPPAWMWLLMRSSGKMATSIALRERIN